MKTRVFILAAFFLIIILVAALVYKNRQPAIGKVNQNLSDRTDEFLTAQRVSQDNTQAAYIDDIDLTGENSQIPITNIQTPCFEFISTSKMVSVKKSEDTACGVAAKLLEPSAYLTISATRSSLPLSEQSGVVLRQKFPEKYQPVEMTLPSFSSVKAYSTDQEMTVFLQRRDQVVILALTQILDPTQITPQTVGDLLNQVEWQPNFVE